MSVQFKTADKLPEVKVVPRGPTWHVVNYKPEYSFPDIHPPAPDVPDIAPPTKSPKNSVAVQLDAAQELLREIQIQIHDTTSALHAESELAIAQLGPAFDEIAQNGIQIFGLSSQFDNMVAEVSLEGYTRVNSDSSMAGEISLLTANFNGMTAQIVDEQLVRASATEAITARIDRMTSVMDGVVAQASEEVYTRVNQGEAFVTRVDTLTAQYHLVSAQIITEQDVRATADSAMAAQINSILTSSGSTSASLVTEAATRAAADAALSGQIITASTTLAGHTASISSILGSINGLAAQWAIQATIDGTTGGLIFTGLKRADGTGASFSLEIFADVVIHGSLVVDGTIVNPKIADNSVSNSGASTGLAASTSQSGIVAISARAGARIMCMAFYNGGDSFNSATPGYYLKLYTSFDGITYTMSNQCNIPYYIAASVPPTASMFACSCVFVTNYPGSPGTFFSYCTTDGPPAFFHSSVTIYVLELDK